MMHEPPPPIQYLAAETGLHADRAMYLFYIGYPWPLFYGEIVPLLMKELEPLRRSWNVGPWLSGTSEEPGLTPLRDHILNMLLVSERDLLPETLFHLWRALQEYAVLHPDWRQVELAEQMGVPMSHRGNALPI